MTRPQALMRSAVAALVTLALTVAAAPAVAAESVGSAQRGAMDTPCPGGVAARVVTFTGSGAASTGTGGTGMTQVRSYDNAGRVTGVTNIGPGVGAGGSLATTYTLDEAGQPALVSQQRGTGSGATTRHTGYAYTSQGWVAQECEYGATAPTSPCDGTSTPRISYAYDAVGNRTEATETDPAGVTTETVDSVYDATDQLTSQTTTTGGGSPTTVAYSYDANGQLTTGGRTYDALGRITGKDNPAGTGQIGFAYNPAGHRTSVVRTGVNAGTQALVWDTNNALPLIAQTTNTGATLGAGSGTQTHLWTPGGLPVATYQAGGGSWWYTHDGLGSVTDITTGDGEALTSMGYTLFGEQSLVDHRPTPTTDPVNPGFGYTAGYTHLADPELHLRARDYDPTLARFTAPDPLTPDNGAAAFTTYRYANNSPLVYIDPTGQWGLDADGLWQELKDAGSTIISTAKTVGVGIFEESTNHVVACAEHDGSGCGALFLDLVTLGTAEAAAADLEGCAEHDKSSCGWLFVDIATLGTAGGGAARTACTSVRRAEHAATSAAKTASKPAATTAANALPALPKALSGGAADTYVYLGTRGGKNVYTGITNNLTRRGAQHGDRFDQLVRVTNAPVTRGQARSIEQALIARNPGFENKINSISPTHSYYDDAVSWGESWLRQNGF